ncbi:uncharacterized protein SPAPADRAFT_52427 [Spathaspora passalidarum NRRL Y-27907]|uniref:Copper transport protein n=1 Tax=Spathaspora passalidarum (strain NRRL Y-27907 / 11-Y1) TaxID=619300 RepID=G3ATV7_SPAPN|nr:uncharacterized protein SPAPADRAFT_52427 [Spathaspora passalidarum NRRL Y-27907]EGW30334.1 hypothetical protein SPAPADRAFT_52427 [Spathaspora passalidarum NRRL Y-27907]
MSFQNKHMMMSMDSDTATATMDMVMETASSAMDHMSSHDDMAGMHMYFTAQFKGYPVIFKNLVANNKGQAFGIFLLLFFVAFLNRLLEFVRNYLEEVVWQNREYQEFESGIANAPANLQSVTSGANCHDTNSSDDSLHKGDSVQVSKPVKSLPIASTLFRDAIRLFLCIVPDLFGYALMLGAMTFTLTYFFAIVIGSGVGRFTSERLMERFRLKRTPPLNCC